MTTAAGDTHQDTDRGPSSPWVPERERDLGFGSVVASESRTRLLNRDGGFNVRREGLRFWRSLSLYHWLLKISWTAFFLLVACSYVAVNAIFATVYFLAVPMRSPMGEPTRWRAHG